MEWRCDPGDPAGFGKVLPRRLVAELRECRHQQTQLADAIACRQDFRQGIRWPAISGQVLVEFRITGRNPCLAPGLFPTTPDTWVLEEFVE